MQTDQKRHAYLKKTYGLSPVMYQTMLDSNKGLCHVCDKHPMPGKNLCVDHDHRSGEIRGLLCFL